MVDGVTTKSGHPPSPLPLGKRKIRPAVLYLVGLSLSFAFALKGVLNDVVSSEADDKVASVASSLSLLQKSPKQAVPNSKRELFRNNNTAAVTSSSVPHILMFTHRTNLLGMKAATENLKFFENILHTIETYLDAWIKTGQHDEEKPKVWFLDHEECKRAIELVEPRLIPYYENETDGSFLGDVCRAAALYLKGGYYFDVDMEAIDPVILPSNISFSSVYMNPKAFFQSFLAASPQNDIILDSISLFLHYYEQKALHEQKRSQPIISSIRNAETAVESMLSRGQIGTYATKSAYDNQFSLNATKIEQSSLILAEDNLQSRRRYPHINYRDYLQEAAGCCCNYVVHNPALGIPHFFSRFAGSGSNCALKDKSKPLEEHFPAMKWTWSERQAKLPSTDRVEYFHLPLNET